MLVRRTSPLVDSNTKYDMMGRSGGHRGNRRRAKMRRAKGRRKRAAINAARELIDLSRQRNFCCIWRTSTPTTTNIIVKASGIDDPAVGALVSSPAVDRVVGLNLSHNNIAFSGCQSLATQLQNTNSCLEKLDLRDNNIGDEEALLLAHALAANHKLKYLNINHNRITATGWSAFSKILFNTSSINNTFLSNHTLEGLSVLYFDDEVDEVLNWLYLNRSSEDKRQVAIIKILKHHQHFDMQPFFECDMKVLPVAINWFERAQSILITEWFARLSPFAVSADSQKIGKQKLGVIYQFIREMPNIFE